MTFAATRMTSRRVIRTGESPAQPRGALWRHDHILHHTSPADLWEMRMSFEPQLAGMAALRGTPREIDHIADLHGLAVPARFDRELDVALHRAIARASHNALGALLVDRMTQITLEPSFVGRAPPLTQETGYDHHQALVQALLARDAAQAERAMRVHLHAIALWAKGLGLADATEGKGPQ